MLVLTRKTNECIRIGDDIEVKVLDIGGGRVRLGFSAPFRVDIRRQELDDVRSARAESWVECDAVGALCSQA